MVKGFPDRGIASLCTTTKITPLWTTVLVLPPGGLSDLSEHAVGQLSLNEAQTGLTFRVEVDADAFNHLVRCIQGGLVAHSITMEVLALSQFDDHLLWRDCLHPTNIGSADFTMGR